MTVTNEEITSVLEGLGYIVSMVDADWHSFSKEINFKEIIIKINVLVLHPKKSKSKNVITLSAKYSSKESQQHKLHLPTVDIEFMYEFDRIAKLEDTLTSFEEKVKETLEPLQDIAKEIDELSGRLNRLQKEFGGLAIVAEGQKK
ncbi:hypothetical protein ACFLQI_00830 [Candidatus Undinarchaeota archaeon]